MENIMSGSRIILRAVAAAAVGAALFAGHAQAIDKVTFQDVLKPHGHARSKSEKLAAGQACGTSGPRHILTTTLPVFEKCMRRKGWVLTHYQRDPSSRSHRSFASSWLQPAPSYDSGPSPDPLPPGGPDTAGMNTPTNPTWSGFN
jgi:hypothetical protein